MSKRKLKGKIAEAHQMVTDLATEADGLENKHLRDILNDAKGRLHDAENHPQADEEHSEPDPAVTQIDPTVGPDGRTPTPGAPPIARGAPGTYTPPGPVAPDAPRNDGQMPPSAVVAAREQQERDRLANAGNQAITPEPRIDRNDGTHMPQNDPFPGNNAAADPDPFRRQATEDADKKKDDDTKKPGDPEFMPKNPDFRAPDNVDLNPDGTLRTAPNTLGKSDVRKE